MGRKRKEELPEGTRRMVEDFTSKYTVKSQQDLQEAMREFFGQVLQSFLEAEMDSKLGYSKNERSNNENSRNGYYPEREVNTNYGAIPVSVPRDRNREIESDLIPKYSRNINGFDEKIIRMYGRGMSDKQISEEMYELFDCNLTKDIISDITDKIIPEIQEWQKRKLDKVYPIVFIDAIHFSVKDNGQVVKKAAYVILGVDVEGYKSVLSITIGENESAKM